MSNKTGVFIVAATVVILGGIACIGFTIHEVSKGSSVSILLAEGEKLPTIAEEWQVVAEKWQVVAERAITTGQKWQATAESNGKELSGALAALALVEQSLSTKTAKTPFQFAKGSTRDAQNIEFIIDGQLVFLVGPGAQAVLEELR